MAQQFYVTLPSDSSISYYPDNTVAHYTTKLSQPIDLDGEYEVGLTEIIYPHSWLPRQNNSENYWVEVQLSDSPPVRCVFTFGLYKTTEDMLIHLNKQIEDGFSTEILREYGITMEKLPFKFHFYLNISQYIHFKIDGLDNSTSLVISKSLWELLGFGLLEDDLTLRGNRARDLSFDLDGDEIFDMYYGLRLMYVYCDVVAHTCVGDTQVPLLRACETEGKYGDTVRKSFVDTHYVPVQKRHFDTIEISINTEDGKSMPFQFGKLLVKLHFRRTFNLSI